MLKYTLEEAHMTCWAVWRPNPEQAFRNLPTLFALSNFLIHFTTTHLYLTKYLPKLQITMSFHGFEPHNNSDDHQHPSRLQRDDASDSGYGGSVTSSSAIEDDSPTQSRSLSLNFPTTPERATYLRGSSAINHHRSPSGKISLFSSSFLS